MRSWSSARLGPLRVSTIVLIVAFLALFWVYHNFEPKPVSIEAPTTAVVPPGFVPDPNYTWVPRTNVRRPKETVPTTTTETTTSTSTSPTETTTSPGESTGPASPTESTPTTTTVPGPLGPQTTAETQTPTATQAPGAGPAPTTQAPPT